MSEGCLLKALLNRYVFSPDLKVALDGLDWIGPYWIGREFHTAGETKQIRKWLVLQWGRGILKQLPRLTGQQQFAIFGQYLVTSRKTIVTMEPMEDHMYKSDQWVTLKHRSRIRILRILRIFFIFKI